MGFGSVFGTIAFMFVFASMVVFAVQTQKNLTAQAGEQRLAAERDRAERESSIAITATGYAVGATVDWTTTTYADFEDGALVNTAATSPGTVVLSPEPYPASGTWTSVVFDTGDEDTDYTTLSWTAVLPVDTSLSFQARSADTIAALEAGAFTGPDGTAGTNYTASGASLNATVHNDTRYIQLQATLTSANPANTPQLQEVRVGVTRPGGVASVTVQNTGSESFPHSETDLYLAGERVPRNESSRTLDLDGTTDQLLWRPGESVTYTIFRSVATPASVTVANGAARAAGAVS